MKIYGLQRFKPIHGRRALGVSLVALAVCLPPMFNALRGRHTPDSNPTPGTTRLAVEFMAKGSGGPAEYVSFVDNGEGGGTAGNGIRDGIEKIVQRGFIRHLPDTPQKNAGR